MITQKTIANRLGISVSLVSRALSGTAIQIGASPVTVDRICAEAARLNYRRNAAALSLRGISTQTLGVVVKNFDDPFFGHMIAELETLATGRGFSLLLTGCRPDADIHSLAKYTIDGLIIAGSDFLPAGLPRFIERGIPVVRIGCGTPLAGVTSVLADIEHGLGELVEHLTKLGHRDIGFIGDDSELSRRREQELLNVLKQARLFARPNCFVRTKYTGVDTGAAAMQGLLRQCGDLRPTAVIAAEDLLAQTALRALYENRLQVPADISLASVDDIPSAHMTIPALTTVRQPIPEMVRRAFEALMDKSSAPKAIVVRPELVVRESCGAPREQARG